MDKQPKHTRAPEPPDDVVESGDAVPDSADAAPDTDLDSVASAPSTQQPADSSVSGLQESVAEPREARLQKALDEQRDKYVRLAAEFDNYRKRSLRERQEAGWRAQSDLVLGLIEALDDIMRFAHLDPATIDSATVVQGVALVERKILKSLSGHGLEVLLPLDQPFDPAFHEAVGTEPALSAEDDHLIAKVYQAGYVFRGQLLRPARVVVKQWLG
jgi:molecular chaperone GrpE